MGKVFLSRNRKVIGTVCVCRVDYGLCTGGECPIADLQKSTLHILSRGLWCKDLFLPKKKGVKERKEKPVQATVFTNHFIQS